MKKLLFVYECKLQLLTSKKDEVHVFIYTKSKKIAKRFSIQKTRQRPLRFYIQKAGHFMLQDFT